MTKVLALENTNAAAKGERRIAVITIEIEEPWRHLEKWELVTLLLRYFPRGSLAIEASCDSDR